MAKTGLNVPGPGVYEAKGRIGEGPKFVMGEKLQVGGMTAKSFVPGAGTYQPTFKDHGPTYSIRLKTKIATSLSINPDGTHDRISQSVDFTPGPGAYQSKPVYARVHSGCRWGHDKRGDMADPNGKF